VTASRYKDHVEATKSEEKSSFLAVRREEARGYIQNRWVKIPHPRKCPGGWLGRSRKPSQLLKGMVEKERGDGHTR